jgi:aminoacyl-tRNA hydrolase
MRGARRHRDWYLSALRMRVAIAYRLCLRRVTFVGITGSCGKTTTKELIAAILQTSGRGRKSIGNNNFPEDLARVILKVRPRDAFCVLEISVGKGGEESVFAKSLQLARPKVAVVTNVSADHIAAFKSLEAIAAQKGKLVAALPSNGIAVLNADDPLVLGMRKRCAGQIITYGISAAAAVRAEDVRSRWPDRLAFTLVYDGKRHPVQTQLCGRHWVTCVLAALSAGMAMDVSLAKAIAAVSSFTPEEGRMSPEVREDGVTFIRDDFKNPLWSIPAALEFMEEADAKRKIVVIGTISDYKGEDATAVSVAMQALAVADQVVFVGPKALKCMKANTDPHRGRLHAFLSLDHAHDMLKRMLRPGDLVLLKGTSKDNLRRLLSIELEVARSPRSPPSSGAEAEEVETAGCSPVQNTVSRSADLTPRVHGSWAPFPTARGAVGVERLEAERKALRSRMHGLYSRRNALFKEIGSAKRRGAGDATAMVAEAAELSAELKRLGDELEQIQRRIDGPSPTEVIATPVAWVVGLGNPTKELFNTPHNAGQAVVDLLAKELAGEWVQEGSSLVWEVNWRETQALLVKPLTPMNNIGPALLDLAQRRELSPRCGVLVHDDVALPLGAVRSRSQVTDGGHRGVRSILEAFETDCFLRVKIGVASPSRRDQRMQGVLTAFTDDEVKVVERAYATAASKILELLRVSRDAEH